MTVKEAIEKFGFSAAAGADETDREITGVYAGDLLSWVMARLGEGNAWITIMGHMNVVAVANLAGAACIIVAEGAEVAPETAAKADSMGIPVLRTKQSIYDVAKLFAEFY